MKIGENENHHDFYCNKKYCVAIDGTEYHLDDDGGTYVFCNGFSTYIKPDDIETEPEEWPDDWNEEI